MRRLKRAVVPALLLLALYYALFGGEYSAFELRRTRMDVDGQKAELAELRLRIDSLQARIDSLEHDPATLERIARERFGLIREGETLYRFAPSSEGEPAVDTTGGMRR